MIKVLVTDDHHLVRSSVIQVLKGVASIDIIGEASTGEETIELCQKYSPHVVLMDLQMPGIGGLEATRKILRRNPAIRVVVLTICDDGPFPARLLHAGASGYLTKSAQLHEMVDAIKTVSKGQRYLSFDIAQKLALKQYGGHFSPFDLLSDREMQITMMILECQKVQTISDKLCLSPKTVNSYRYRIFDKLSIHGDVELVLLAVKYGILRVERTDFINS